MTKMMKAMSFGQYPSMNGSSAITGVKQMRTTVMMLGRVHIAELSQHLYDVLADALERVEYSVTRERDSLEVRRTLHPVSVLLCDQKLSIVVGVRHRALLHRIRNWPTWIQRRLELGNGCGVGEISFIVLNGKWNLAQIVSVLRHVLIQVLHGLDVRVHPFDLTVRDEDHAVHTLEDQLSRGVVVHLAGHCVEMKLDLEPPNRAKIHRQEIEEEGALGLRRKGNHLPARARSDLVVDVLEVGGLSAKARAVVDQLTVDFARGVIDHRHAWLSPQAPKSLSISSSASPRNSDSTPGALVPSRLNMSVKTWVNCTTAALTRSFTSPSVVRLSNSTTRMTRRAMSAKYIDSRSPWWKSAPNSDSPSIRAN